MPPLFQKHQESLRVLQAIITIVCLPSLVGVGAWALLELIDHGERIAVLESNAGRGEPLTKEEQKEATAAMMKLIADLQAVDLRFADRIRHLEIQQAQTISQINP